VIADHLLAGTDPKTIFDPNGLIDDLTKSSPSAFLTPRWIVTSTATKRPATVTGRCTTSEEMGDGIPLGDRPQLILLTVVAIAERFRKWC
jgi:hypothetical protein